MRIKQLAIEILILVGACLHSISSASEEKPVALPFELPSTEPGETITLERALRLANERNLSLEATRQEILKAEANLKSARANLFPVVAGTLTLTHLDHEEEARLGGNRIVTRNQDSLQGAIEVDVPLVNPSAWLGVGVNQVGTKVASITVENARQALLLSVAKSFYQALTAGTLIEIYEVQLQSAARRLEITKTRLISGLGKRLDLDRIKNEIAKIKEALIMAHSTYTNTRDTLGWLTGAGGLPIPKDVVEMSPPREEEQELVSKSLKRREDIKLKRAISELNRKSLDAAWMQFLPSLNASWQLTHQFTSPSAFGSQDRTRWTAFLVLSVPIYTQTRYADLDKGRAALRKSDIEARDTAQSAALEVRKARRGYETAVDRIATAVEQSELAREILFLTESEYIAGTGSSLEVTDASRQSREAEFNLAARRFEAQIALLDLLYAAGRDLSEPWKE